MGKELTEFMSAIEKLAPYLKIHADNMENIRGQKDIEHMGAVFRMVLCGIEKEKIRRISEKTKNSDINIMNTLIIEELSQQYGQSEKVKQQLEEANKMMVKITEKNEEIRDMFEVDVKTAIEREHIANEKLIQQYREGIKAKDTAFNLIKQQCAALEKDLLKKEEDITALTAQLEKKNMLDESESQKKNVHILARFSAKKIFWKKRRQLIEYNHFIVELAKNNAFSKEQAEFILNLLKEGMPLKVVKQQFLYPEISLEMMKTMKKYMNI